MRQKLGFWIRFDNGTTLLVLVGAGSLSVFFYWMVLLCLGFPFSSPPHRLSISLGPVTGCADLFSGIFLGLWISTLDRSPSSSPSSSCLNCEYDWTVSTLYVHGGRNAVFLWTCCWSIFHHLTWAACFAIHCHTPFSLLYPLVYVLTGFHAIRCMFLPTIYIFLLLFFFIPWLLFTIYLCHSKPPTINVFTLFLARLLAYAVTYSFVFIVLIVVFSYLMGSDWVCTLVSWYLFLGCTPYYLLLLHTLLLPYLPTLLHILLSCSKRVAWCDGGLYSMYTYMHTYIHSTPYCLWFVCMGLFVCVFELFGDV